VLDNLSHRTQRRGDLKLEIDLHTHSAEVSQLVAGIQKIADRPEVENALVHLSDITGNAIVIHAEYYTAPVTIQEFNLIKQAINMQSLQMLEELKIELAGASTDIRLSKEIS
jgi:MscS family membrane protein